MPKPSDADKEYFRSLVPEHPGVVVKPMFGNLGAFINGNMFAALFGHSVGVRLSEASAGELRAIKGSGPFGPAERPMSGYVALPLAWRTDPELASDWVARALETVAAMPPKVAKPKAAKKTNH